jgi:hypothetical protein
MKKPPKKKRPYVCGLEASLDLVNGKWKPLKYMTASAMSLTMEGRPFGNRLSTTSFGVFRWSGV